jgi:caspase domain-containing protein
MRALAVIVMGCVMAALAPAPAWSAEPLERLVLVVGANGGGRDRPALKYAVADAERFARVLVDLGGVAPSNETLLRQPSLHELTDALDVLARRIEQGRRSGRRTEMIVYFSGHADETGLLLGDDRYSYRTLRDRLDRIPADVRIAVLDACSSGAFTRVKSGRPRPSFLVDESSDMRGHAFLTSSSENEAAQESDRIRASYFTHYLVSGLRGAADSSGDGKVTLSEAYQFAFNETLGRTLDTKSGAQHPSYDISMSGTGDVVMTDVHQTNATLVLGENLEGRFFVRTSAQELVVELYKPRGRTVELAVEAGIYNVRLEREKSSLVTVAEIADGARVVLEPRQFGQAAAPEPTRSRGTAPPLRYAVSGRHRVEIVTGVWQTGDNGARVQTGTIIDTMGGLVYSHYVREDLAMTVSLTGTLVQSGSNVGSRGVSSGDVVVSAIFVGGRWNPRGPRSAGEAFKPFVTAALGPVTGLASGSFVSSGGSSISAGDQIRTTLGGHFGGGVDAHVSRRISIGLDVGYNAMLNFTQPVALYKNFNGPQVTVGFGLLFGKGN